MDSRVSYPESWATFLGILLRKKTKTSLLLLPIIILMLVSFPQSEGKISTVCKPSGHIVNQGKLCKEQVPEHPCCVENIEYPVFHCSPRTGFVLTLNDFSEGGSGGGKSKCTGKFHSNEEKVVALSTGLFQEMKMCGRSITLTLDNKKFVQAKVIDECDSLHGCDAEHDFQPTCAPNVIDGSLAVWDALGADPNKGVIDVIINLSDFEEQEKENKSVDKDPMVQVNVPESVNLLTPISITFLICCLILSIAYIIYSEIKHRRHVKRVMIEHHEEKRQMKREGKLPFGQMNNRFINSENQEYWDTINIHEKAHIPTI